jgi:predicted transcriptional regulator
MSATNPSHGQGNSNSSVSKSQTSQLNVRIDQLLAQRLRQKAKELHCSPGTLVAQAIEQLLDSNMQEQAQEAPEGVTRRLKDLEARVAELEQQGHQQPSQ